MQTNVEFKTSRTNFDDCQENADLFSKLQAELKSQIEQYELLYKKHVMLKSELVEVTVKEDAVNNSQTKEIDLIKRKLNKVKIRIKLLEEKNGLLEHHNQMIDTNNNQLTRRNMILSKKISNTDEQIE
jgi:hypothetical protein